MRGLSKGDENEASEAIDKADQFLKQVKEVEKRKKKYEPRDNTGNQLENSSSRVLEISVLFISEMPFPLAGGEFWHCKLLTQNNIGAKGTDFFFFFI